MFSIFSLLHTGIMIASAVGHGVRDLLGCLGVRIASCFIYFPRIPYISSYEFQ